MQRSRTSIRRRWPEQQGSQTTPDSTCYRSGQAVKSDRSRSKDARGGGEIEVSANEWARAANLRDRYWLYVVYDCATPAPRLLRVQDPFQLLLAQATGAMRIPQAEIQAAGS